MTLEDHCNLQHEVFVELQDKGYTKLQQNVPYHRKIGNRDIYGEVDIFGLHPRQRYYLFVEIKSSKKAYYKALSQFHRYVVSHPELEGKIKGMFVCPTQCRRLYLPQRANTQLVALSHQ